MHPRLNARGHQRSARALAIGVVCLMPALVGCTGAPHQGEIEFPPQNEARWVMPLDEFIDQSPPLRDYSEALLDGNCLQEAGIEWPVPWQPIDRGLSESFAPTGRRIFNLELAKSWGYHSAPNLDEALDAWREFGVKANEIAASTPGFDAIFDGCLGKTRETIPLLSDDARNYALMAAHQAQAESLLKDEVIATISGWRTCMNERGYTQLTESPNDMPPESLRGAYGLGIPGSVAEPAEIALAVADAECSESSGYSTALYQAEWDLQAKFVEENTDKLLSVRTELAADRERLLSVIAENAPKQ